jgi:hypothetical protein
VTNAAATKLAEQLRKLDAKRVAEGRCRHCGGTVPCWSVFGDVSVGRRYIGKKRTEKLAARFGAVEGER